MSFDPRISPILPVSMQTIHNIQTQIALEDAKQVASEQNLSEYFDVNPLLQAQRFKNFHELKSHLTDKSKETEELEEQKIFDVEKVEEAAAEFEQNNEELDARVLLILRNRSAEKSDPDEILETLIRTYPDPSLADEATDFLIATASPERKELFREVKRKLNDRYFLEIKAGRNMGAESRAFAKEGLGSPVSLRDLYRDILNNPREPTALFNQLSEKYPYNKLRTVISFLLKSLGSDLRSKGPSISRPELQRLIEETRSLQGILGVYRFFQSRMPLILSAFKRADLAVPPKLNFENLARIFVALLLEKFINPDRILMAAKILGISEELLAQIIIFTQMRDALRQVAPRYFRNPRHREEMIKAFLDALEKLDKEQEEEEEEES